MAFDFAAYLNVLTGRSWHIEELSGGNANHTVRATQEHLSSNYHHGRQEETELNLHSSLVLKQAPPFFAKFPSMKFSQQRQVTEAKALRLFHGDNTLAIVLQEHPCIRIASLLHHDVESHVLVQSDLGRHPTLETFLLAPTTNMSLASSAGFILGCFLAKMHRALPVSASSRLIQEFKNDDAEEVMHMVIENATIFMKDAGVPDFGILGRRAKENWENRDKTVFGQGDIWFGTVLIDANGPRCEHTPAISICDWEFAGPNHPAGDIAQLGSYLHLLSISPYVTTHREKVIAFSEALYSAYFSYFRVPHSLAEFERSLVIMHGWELINAAAWRHHLWCDCPGSGVKCAHITAMVREGASLLRAAGDPPDHVRWQMLENIHWCRFLRLQAPRQ